MNKILVPFINNNETEAKLVSWDVDDESLVKKGDIIGSIETTKADIDLETEFEGIIKIIAIPGNDYPFGETIAMVFDNEKDLKNHKFEKPKIKDQKVIITKPAREYMEFNNISEKDVLKLGLSIVKKKDIEHLNRNSKDDMLVKISPRQVAIGNTVMSSKLEIPDAFQIKKVNMSLALKKMQSYSEKNKLVLGIAEIMVFTISKLHEEYPFFFGEIMDNQFFKKSLYPNIGVTLDIGNGLFIPVILKANKLSIDEISKILTSFKLKAIKNSFKIDELQNANFTISLNMDEDTLLVKPIIFPGQTCMISINAITKELVLDNGKLQESRNINLGLAYDHRVINGYEANSFLTDIKKYIENDFNI